MIEDHEQFMEDVISAVTDKSNADATKKLRRNKERVTVESLMEVTGLSRAEINKIMEKKRKEQLAKQSYFSTLYKNIVRKIQSFQLIIVVLFMTAVVAVVMSVIPSTNGRSAGGAHSTGVNSNIEWVHVEGLSKIVRLKGAALLDRKIIEIIPGYLTTVSRDNMLGGFFFRS